jgi:hypothetical protein
MMAVKRLVWCGTAGSVFLAGCYTLEPARLSPEPGSVIALDITDRGRVALGGEIGPELSRVEGRLVSRDTTEYVLGVTGVQFLRGGEQVWHGETVHLKSDYVGTRYERRFSATRSVALGALAAGAVAIVATTSLRGFGQGDRSNPTKDSGATQIRIPVHIPIRIPLRLP